MREWVATTIVAALTVSVILAGARDQRPTAATADYVAALSVANQFLHAWIQRDQSPGIQLMSPRLRSSPAADKSGEVGSWLEQYMSGLSNPHHVAFEIGQGRSVAKGRFEFPVVLYEWADGEPAA